MRHPVVLTQKTADLLDFRPRTRTRKKMPIPKHYWCAFICGIIAASVTAENSQGQLQEFFDDKEVEFFQRNGYLKVSGLLDDTLLNDLTKAAAHTIQTSPKFPFYYSVSQSGLLFGRSTATTLEDDPQQRPNQLQQQANGTKTTTITTPATTQAFRQAALYSKFPQAVAELMKLDPATHNLRVLR